MTADPSDVASLRIACEHLLSSTSFADHVPDGYQSVPLCAIDAIYSIGVRYEGVVNVVERYKAYWRARGTNADSQAHCTHDFLDEFAESTDLADSLFDNRQRTSPRGGILKADAVVQLLEVLGSPPFDIQTTQQLRDHFNDEDLDGAIRAVRGQSSGISAKYLFLLAGVDDAVKPDRMIVRFVSSAVARRVTPMDAQELLIAASRDLRAQYPKLTPRVLDHAIWHRQREGAS